MCPMTVKHNGIICILVVFEKRAKCKTRQEVDGAADILEVNSLVFIFFFFIYKGNGNRKIHIDSSH